MNVVLRHDLQAEERDNFSQQYPHLLFHNFTTHLGERVSLRSCGVALIAFQTQNILKYLFPVPKGVICGVSPNLFRRQ